MLRVFRHVDVRAFLDRAEPWLRVPERIVLSLVIDGERISRIYNVRNPDKLIGIALRDLAL
jgi:hypothetical protein